MGSPAMCAVHSLELIVALSMQVVLGCFSRSTNSGVSSAAMIAVPTHGSILSFLEAL